MSQSLRFPLLSLPLTSLLSLTALFSVARAAEEIDFARQILPILSNKCFVCHGPDADEDFLRLDSFEAATKELDGSRAIDPDSPEDSQVLLRLHSADDPMPPADAEKQLTDDELSLLSNWVKAGGRYAKHWAFVPPKKSNDKNAIDEFIEAKVAERGWTLAERAEREVLARRVAFTLTGLPPEPEWVQDFLAAKDFETGYQRLIDTLFASPRYGEHQARYWLDAVRYGDTHGLHLDNRRGIYPYRDWVVRSLNENLPLDQFIEWQLAGDLLPNPTMDQRIATGFVRLNPSTSEGGAIAAEFQAKNNFDRTETLGTVLLGMTFTCARCHTHKYDPITQTEYYRLLAFFNSTAERALDGNKYDYAPALKVPSDAAALSEYTTVLDEQSKLLESSEAAVSQLAEKWQAASSGDKLSLLEGKDSQFELSKLLQRAQELAKQREDLESKFTTTLIAQELEKRRETFVLHRGEYDQPQGDPVEPGVPVVMGGWGEELPQDRLGLAKWLTSKEQPLVARVLVNRIWQRVYGQGLVRTPEDFGLQGQQPTHPELLDWLAVELQESGWDLQHMLRLMLNSQTFQQSSAWREESDDPENLLWARGPSYRMDAEVIRDTALWASALLDPTVGGEGVKPYQPVGMWAALAHPASNTKKYEQDQGSRLYRRSLYVYWKRTSPHPMMTIFDAPDRESSCVRRSRTNTALQSLGLFNETQRIEMARKFAERLLREQETDEERVRTMFRLLACEPPKEAERAAVAQLLQQARSRYSGSGEAAKQLLSHGEAALPEDINPEELAAWTQVTNVILASDLALRMY